MLATLETQEPRQLHPCCTPNCHHLTYTLWCAACLAGKRAQAGEGVGAVEGATECDHRTIWWSASGSTGIEYFLSKVGQDFFGRPDQHQPEIGETVEVCSVCGMVRYFFAPDATMAEIIRNSANEGKRRKKNKSWEQHNRVQLDLRTYPDYPDYPDWQDPHEYETDITDVWLRQYVRGEPL